MSQSLTENYKQQKKCVVSDKERAFYKKNGYLILSISETIFKKLGFDTELAYRSNEYTSLYVSRPFLALPRHDSSAKNKIYILRKS